jgi:NAD(P)-dependent dehydrogenase (short-subunit alcohol dehydrogenase family)
MKDRIALVTGANRGIGFEVCRQLGQLGIQVILTSRDYMKGEAAAEILRGEGLPIHFMPLDVTDPGSVMRARDLVLANYERLDVLVNNAGVYLDDGISILDISLDLLRETFEVNTFGAFTLCKAFIPIMRQHNYGRVVNVSSEDGSLAGMTGTTGAYRMSKTAMNALTRVLAHELRRTNIKVNSVCPGWVATDMGGSEAPRTPAEGAETIVWLATLPDDGPTGGFFLDKEPLAW